MNDFCPRIKEFEEYTEEIMDKAQKVATELNSEQPARQPGGENNK